MNERKINAFISFAIVATILVGFGLYFIKETIGPFATTVVLAFVGAVIVFTVPVAIFGYFMVRMQEAGAARAQAEAMRQAAASRENGEFYRGMSQMVGPLLRGSTASLPAPPVQEQWPLLYQNGHPWADEQQTPPDHWIASGGDHEVIAR